MAESDRTCVGCGATEAEKHLERCSICHRHFCADCAHRALGGRKFCSPECGRTYYFQGDSDDDDEDAGSDD
jgi:hypothetical protein